MLYYSLLVKISVPAPNINLAFNSECTLLGFVHDLDLEINFSIKLALPVVYNSGSF